VEQGDSSVVLTFYPSFDVLVHHDDDGVHASLTIIFAGTPGFEAADGAGVALTRVENTVLSIPIPAGAHDGTYVVDDASFGQEGGPQCSASGGPTLGTALFEQTGLRGIVDVRALRGDRMAGAFVLVSSAGTYRGEFNVDHNAALGVFARPKGPDALCCAN
jgi:hypothetical protein